MRGQLSTLVFMALFLLLLTLALNYVVSVDARESGLATASNLDRASMVHDDVSTIYRSLIELGPPSVWKNSTFASISFSNRIPSGLTNATAELASLQSFLQGTYSNKTGAGISTDSARFAAPFLYFEGPGLNVSYDSVQRQNVTISGNPSVTAYTLGGYLNDTCKKGKCASAGASWNWIACGPTTVAVQLDILDASGSLVRAKGQTSGCVAAGSANQFTITTASGGTLTMTIGNVTGASPAMRISSSGSVAYNARFWVNMTGTPNPARAYLPVALTVDGNTIPNLIVTER